MRLAAAEHTTFSVGLDDQKHEHPFCSAPAPSFALSGPDIEAYPRQPDYTFKGTGVFAEIEHMLGMRDLLVAGIRLDTLDVEDVSTARRDTTAPQARSSGMSASIQQRLPPSSASVTPSARPTTGSARPTTASISHPKEIPSATPA